MAQAKYESGESSFHEIWVDDLGSQTAAQRSGIASPDQDASIMPTINRFKNNLTVMSQRENLYFVAYGRDIYVFEPHGPGQLLSKEPSIIFTPTQTIQAQRHCNMPSAFNYYADKNINHIIVGDLGEEEVLICACHDGDVLAYYIRAIMTSLTSPGKEANPFFLQNVGISAWGLAVHKKSRLIAVSSNHHEITLFAFGLNRSSNQEYKPESPSRPGWTPCSCYFARESTFDIELVDVVQSTRVRQRKDALESTICGNTKLSCPHCSNTFNEPNALKQHLEQYLGSPPSRGWIPKTHDGRINRAKNFKLVIHLGPRGANIPSIAFSDDDYGEAQAILAKDINGSLWIFKIWDEEELHLTFPEELDGWGVLVLPPSFFIPTKTYQETFGAIFDSGFWGDDILGETMSNNKALYTEGNPESYSDFATAVEDDTEVISSASDAIELELADYFKPYLKVDVPETARSVAPFIGASLILHSDRHNVQLLFGNGATTICRNIARQHPITGEFAFPDHPWDHNRFNMLAAIPALSLVAVATQEGRVSLLTITRHVVKARELTNTITFRVERNLPPFQLSNDNRPFIAGLGLLGMAVGPTQGDLERHARKQHLSWTPTRYRLMLHYYDHSIISYGLSRHPETQSLQVVNF